MLREVLEEEEMVAWSDMEIWGVWKHLGMCAWLLRGRADVPSDEWYPLLCVAQNIYWTCFHTCERIS